MSDLDRLKAAFQRLLQPLIGRLDYACLYAATVASQNGDGSLELTPSSPKLPPLSKVPLRYGIPGIAAKVNPGALALVGFANADPSQPYAMLTSSPNGVQSISLLGGNQPIARMGDVGSVSFPPVIEFTGTVGGVAATGTITFVPPTPAPFLIISGRKEVTA